MIQVEEFGISGLHGTDVVNKWIQKNNIKVIEIKYQVDVGTLGVRSSHCLVIYDDDK